jgi:hypothetical protein
MRFFSRAFLLSLSAILFAGCAGYQLGSTNGDIAEDKTVQVTPFANQTLEPRLGDAVTSALRKQLQKDGTYRLATHGEGDIVVTGAITRYNRRELSFVPHDVLTVQDYRVSAVAHISARDVSSGKIIFDRSVTNYTLVHVGSDLTSSERQALPLLADELAKSMTALLVDGSW